LGFLTEQFLARIALPDIAKLYLAIFLKIIWGYSQIVAPEEKEFTHHHDIYLLFRYFSRLRHAGINFAAVKEL